MTARNGLSLLFLIASIVCFAIALLIAVGTVHGGNEPAWIAGGLLTFAIAHLGPAWPE